MNLGLKVFLYENGVLLKDVKMLVWERWECVLYIGMWNLFSSIGEKEVLYLQNVLKMNRRNEVPVSILMVLYE